MAKLAQKVAEGAARYVTAEAQGAELLLQNLDVWTAATRTKSTSGRGSGGKIELAGIKKLRELILELAVRGKLVPQDPNDEPASVLLKQIQEEKARLIADGKLKKQKPLPLISDEEKTFELPGGWCWARTGTVSQINPRNDIEDILEVSFVPMALVSTRIDGIHDQESRTWGQVKAGFTHFANGDVAIAKITPCFQNSKAAVFSNLKNGHGAGTTELHVARPYGGVLARFLLLTFKSPRYLQVGESKMTGSAGQKRVPKTYFELAPFALPPVREQHRIVAKVDELMLLCDQLEQQTEQQLDAHQQLVETLLGTLTQSQNAEELSANWQRLAEHFDLLFSGPMGEWAVDRLKDTILQLAVMGKLVPQDPNDEPASVLLERIQQEKARLIAEGKIKKQKPLPPISEEEKPFELPEGWEWRAFGSISELINGDRGKNYPNRDEYVSNGIPWINTGHIEPDGTLTSAGMNFITEEKFNSLRGGKIQPGDLVYCLRGATFGKTAFVSPYHQGAIASSLMIIRPYLVETGNFIFRYLKSPLGESQIYRFDNGSAQPNLSANSVRKYTFPCPPLAEQLRITEKVDELLRACEQLKLKIRAVGEIELSLCDALVDGSLAH